MNQTVTIKIKLLIGKTPEFEDLTQRFSAVCNYVSNWIFTHDFELNQAVINKCLYYEIRNKFKIKAQLTQSAIRTTVAKYKTVKTQLTKKKWHYDDKSTNTNYYAKRDLTWLQKPIQFNVPQAELQRNRDWSIVQNRLSINTLDKCIKTDYICKGFNQDLDESWKLGLGNSNPKFTK